MNNFILFADIFEVLIPLIFVIIWIVSQVMGAGKQQPKGRRQQQQQRGGGKANQPAAPVQAGGGDVDAEIEQFLKNTAKDRGGQQPQEVEVVMLERDDAAPKQPKPIAEKQIGGLDTTDFAQRTSQLGAGVLGEEAQNEARRRKQDQARSKKFDHELGKLDKKATKDRSQQPAKKPKKPKHDIPKTAAAGMAAMLQDGQSIRNAIIFTEIFNRPEDRW